MGNQKVRYILIVILGSIFDIFVHMMNPSDGNTPNKITGSFLTKTLGFELTAVIYFLITFGVLVYVFHRYKDKISGTRVAKGLKYGTAIGILWLWGMLEGPTLWGTTPKFELFMGICDFVPILVIGLLLGRFIARTDSEKDSCRENLFIPLLIFSIVFLIGRYLLYYTKIITSGYNKMPFYTFFWTLLMGTCIGISYLLLRKVTKSSSILKSAIKFGIIIFGLNWGMYLIFMPFVFNMRLAFNMSLMDTIMRIIGDIVWVILSYYFSASLENLLARKNETRSTISSEIVD
ncbi:hypothetical protein [Clostridium sp.]|uniref:hypothetical protein n=1 Tax=Clostridium sp. TaxID=1506 RepID=UPI00262DE752|nr:hypothetical protein [Clostridium sp.]